MPVKGLALISGGLDSALAVKVAQEAGADIEALHFLGPFHTGAPAGAGGGGGTGGTGDAGGGGGGSAGAGTAAQEAVAQPGRPAAKGRDAALVAAELGVPLHVHEFGDEYFDLLHAPAHGYGRGFNPCIDCRIYQFRIARGYMTKIGAAFLVTGEVLGQRPMSQHRQALDLIERESGLQGYVLRPLSAQLLAPTVPEQRGWVDRALLFGIRGRSRREQYALAARYGLTHFQAPAGGCRLTMPDFARRVRDLVAHGGRLDRLEAERLKVGRHLRLGERARAIVGRNQDENRRIGELGRPGDVYVAVRGHMGPLALGIGDIDEGALRLLAGVTARYSDAPRDREAEVAYRRVRPGASPPGEGDAAAGAEDVEYAATRSPDGVLAVLPAGDETITPLRI